VTPLAALVVVHRGGAALERTLASVDWAARRFLVDPAGALSPAAWPAGVGRWPAPADAGWVLLLSEGERAGDELRAILEAAPDDGPPARRLTIEHHAFGGSIRARRGSVRLCRAGCSEVRASLGGNLGFAARGAAPLLPGAVIIDPLLPLPAEAVDALNAEARTLAALAAAHGQRPRFMRLLAGGAAGAAGLLFGKGSGRLGWGRWIAAVLAGYRALLAEAKLWERTQLGA
jgi:hypothetical protein